MIQNILSGTAAVLLLMAIAMPAQGQAESADEGPQIGSASVTTRTLGSQPVTAQPVTAQPVTNPSATRLPSIGTKDIVKDAVKIGTQQSSADQPSSDLTSSAPAAKAGVTQTAIAKVHSHSVAGRRAATLYVRNIPILTFTSAPFSKSKLSKPVAAAAERIKLGQQPTLSPSAPNVSAKSLSRIGAPSETTFEEFKLPSSPALQQLSARGLPNPSLPDQADQSDPVWRASEIAAKLNELSRGGIDASQVTVSLDEAGHGLAGDRYTIKVGDAPLAVVDADTFLPDSTQERSQDVLQATNRLRRVLGGAAPLNRVSYPLGRGGDDSAYGSVSGSMSGLASWYGPGFNGNMSASGEIFNQYDLTAAHRTLPFGTRVRVTNLDNGTTVVVRITDRGPYAGNRILDLSMGAAQVLGLVNSGVAMIRLDILDGQTAQR